MNENELEAGLSQTPGYRYADVVGSRLYVAGQVPLDAAGSLVGAGDVAAQAAQCLSNLFAIIELRGFTRPDIRHLTVHVIGSHEDLSAAWAEVRRQFDGSVPPATLLGASLLGYKGQLVEIDATIERSPNDRQTTHRPRGN